MPSFEIDRVKSLILHCDSRHNGQSSTCRVWKNQLYCVLIVLRSHFNLLRTYRIERDVQQAVNMSGKQNASDEYDYGGQQSSLILG